MQAQIMNMFSPLYLIGNVDQMARWECKAFLCREFFFFILTPGQKHIHVNSNVWLLPFNINKYKIIFLFQY